MLLVLEVLAFLFNVLRLFSLMFLNPGGKSSIAYIQTNTGMNKQRDVG